MKKRAWGLIFALVAALCLLPLAAQAGAAHVHQSSGDSDCIVCKVAGMINALPEKDEITIDNALAVTEQIHAIDRIKVELTDDEYDQMIELVESGNDGTGYGVGVPLRYMDAVKAINNLTGGGSLYIGKSFLSANGETVDVSDAEITVKMTNIATNASQVLSMNSLGVDSSFYSAQEGGWTYKYTVPAGTYRIEEIGDRGAKVNGRPFVTTSTAYVVNGEKSENGAVITVKAGEDYHIRLENSYEIGSLTVKKVVVSDKAEDKQKEFTFKVELDLKWISGNYGGMTFEDGVATFTLKHGESKTAEGLNAMTRYTVTEVSDEGFTTTSEGEAGMIEADQETVAQFTNTRIEEEPSTTPSPVIPVMYKVTFDANGGEGEMEPQYFVRGMLKDLTPNAFTREGYDFTGWNTMEDGSGDAYEDENSMVLIRSITLYAQWQAREPEVFEIRVTAPSGAYKNHKGVYHVLKKDGQAQMEAVGYAVKEWKSNKAKKFAIDALTGKASFKKALKGIKATAILEDGQEMTVSIRTIKAKEFARDIALQAKINGKWQDVTSLELAPGKSVSTRLYAKDGGKIIVEKVEFTDDIATRSAAKVKANLKARKARYSDGKTATMTILANGQTFTLDISAFKGAKDLGPVEEETVEIEAVEELN